MSAQPAMVFVIGAIVGAGAVAPAVARAQTFEGIVTMKVHGGDSAREPREMQCALRQGVARVERPGQGDARAAVISARSATTTTMRVRAPRNALGSARPRAGG